MHRQTNATSVAMLPTTVPGAPPSPTLTNPDMILPFDESPSQTQKFYGPYGDEDWSEGAGNMQFSIGSAHSGLGAITPTTPIIYGNGTMLSDIGEVTEAESTVSKGRRLPGPAERRMLKQRQNEQPLKSSPTVGHETAMKRTKSSIHQRKISMESNSTVRSEGRTTNIFADFDDAASVDDSVFLGDDEGSVADSYVEGVIASETQRLSKATDEDDDANAALSRRAEEILQNAKMRLTNMEGNLSRARSTLGHYPTGSSIHDTSPLNRSTPSPPTKLIPLQLGLPPSKRQLHSPHDIFNGSPSHSKGMSDNNGHSPQFNSPNLIRSASAAARYGTVRHSPEVSRDSPMSGFRNSLISPSGRSASAQNTSRLEPLSENDHPTGVNGRGSGRSSLEGSPGSNESQPLSRSASSMQVRELKDQMTDLKGRLSVLRDRARDDSMKRRSLQSLRTPSPFTAAEQWYTSAKGYGEGNLSADAVVTYAPWQESPISPKAESPKKLEAQHTYPESDVTSVYEDVSEAVDERAVPIGQPQTMFMEDSQAEELGLRYDTAAERIPEDENLSDEIISQSGTDDYGSDVYHDSFPTQVSHEDREDAFDYEHFFLHSAMGTISQQRHGRRGSYSSDDSVETTRGPVTSTTDSTLAKRVSLGHLRNDSEASISTLATFATASEGFEDDDDDHDNFAVQEVVVPQQARSVTPPTGAKRSTFGSPLEALLKAKTEPQNNELGRANSVIRGGDGTNNGHARTGSTASNISSRQDVVQSSVSPVEMLKRDDQVLVENVVAAVGKCVLGLQDTGSSSYEAKVWRRRLDAARRVLEGDEGAV